MVPPCRLNASGVSRCVAADSRPILPACLGDELSGPLRLRINVKHAVELAFGTDAVFAGQDSAVCKDQIRCSGDGQAMADRDIAPDDIPVVAQTDRRVVLKRRNVYGVAPFSPSRANLFGCLIPVSVHIRCFERL